MVFSLGITGVSRKGMGGPPNIPGISLTLVSSFFTKGIFLNIIASKNLIHNDNTPPGESQKKTLPSPSPVNQPAKA
jgi:hypothetical protein